MVMRPRPGSYIFVEWSILQTYDLTEVVYSTNAIILAQSRRDCMFIEINANNDHATPAGVVHFDGMIYSINMRPTCYFQTNPGGIAYL